MTTPSQDQRTDGTDDGTEDQIPRQSVLAGLLAFLPRRNLVKVGFLLLLLLAIVYFQQRADGIAQFMTNTLAPGAPPAKTNTGSADKP